MANARVENLTQQQLSTVNKVNKRFNRREKYCLETAAALQLEKEGEIKQLSHSSTTAEVAKLFDAFEKMHFQSYAALQLQTGASVEIFQPNSLLEPAKFLVKFKLSTYGVIQQFHFTVSEEGELLFLLDEREPHRIFMENFPRVHRRLQACQPAQDEEKEFVRALTTSAEVDIDSESDVDECLEENSDVVQSIASPTLTLPPELFSSPSNSSSSSLFSPQSLSKNEDGSAVTSSANPALASV